MHAQTREYKTVDWRWSLSRVQSVTMVFSALLDVGGGCMLTTVHSIYPLHPLPSKTSEKWLPVLSYDDPLPKLFSHKDPCEVMCCFFK
jgi:hypothetical protein